MRPGDYVAYALPQKDNERGITGQFYGICSDGMATCDFPGDTEWRYVDPKLLFVVTLFDGVIKALHTQ